MPQSPMVLLRRHLSNVPWRVVGESLRVCRMDRGLTFCDPDIGLGRVGSVMLPESPILPDLLQVHYNHDFNTPEALLPISKRTCRGNATVESSYLYWYVLSGVPESRGPDEPPQRGHAGGAGGRRLPKSLPVASRRKSGAPVVQAVLVPRAPAGTALLLAGAAVPLGRPGNLSG